MEVSQSAISHTLTKLRKVLGDPLFIRSGLGLKPTATAITLKQPVQKLIDDLNSLADQRPFDPRTEHRRFVVAASEMERDIVFPLRQHNLLTEMGQ